MENVSTIYRSWNISRPVFWCFCVQISGATFWCSQHPIREYCVSSRPSDERGSQCSKLWNNLWSSISWIPNYFLDSFSKVASGFRWFCQRPPYYVEKHTSNQNKQIQIQYLTLTIQTNQRSGAAKLLKFDHYWFVSKTNILRLWSNFKKLFLFVWCMHELI